MGRKRRQSGAPAAHAAAKKLKLPSGDSAPASERSLGGGEEEDFPRGGQSALSELEKRVIREQATEEALFNESREGEGQREAVVKSAKKKLAAASTRSQRRADTLTPKSLVAGVLVLGAVQEVRDLDISISLPYNMCGTVAIGNVSDPITEGVAEEVEEEDEGGASSLALHRVFAPGQLVVCCVLDEGGRGEGGRRGFRGVNLTVNPRIVNSHLTPRDIFEGMVIPGWVKSTEDHGYVIDFGVSGKTGFLLRKNASEFIKLCNKGKPLVCGQVVRCKVLSAMDTRSVPVSVDPGVVGGALVGGDTLVQLHALQPGLLVNTIVKEVVSNGVIVTFLGGFEGSVGLRHLPSSETLPISLPVKKKVRGRLLWVDVEGKKVGVSLQPTLVDGRSHTFQGAEFGDIFKDAEITRVFPDSSLLLRLSADCLGYCPLPLVSDEKQGEKRGRQYQVGSHHTCRVVQFNLMDGTAIVSLQVSVLSQRYIRYSDIAIGDVLEGIVEHHGHFGMIVSIQGSIHGLCPVTHLSDSQLRAPQRRYQVGASVKCRVLQVDPGERRVLLTCKKSLLRLPQEELLTDYAQAEPRRVFRGVVNRVGERGLSVFFFNNVRGYVPQAEMGQTQGSYPEPSTVARPGQTLECRIISCEPDTKRLLLSLRLESEGGCEAGHIERLRPGMRIVGEVGGVAPEGLSVRCRESGEFGFLPTQHLSDYPSHCARLLSQHQLLLEEAVREGRSYELQDVLVVCSRQSFRPALLSLKPSLLQSADQGWVEDHSQLKPDQLLTGFIKKVMSYGCFVEFPHNLSALAPTRFLQDEFTSDPSLVYQEGQTVFAKVLEVNEDKRRFLVSLKPSDVRVGSWPGGQEVEERSRVLGERLQRFLAEREMVLEAEQALPPGTVVRGMVRSVVEKEVELELSGGQLAKASTHTAPGVRVKVGEEIVGCVLWEDGGEVRVSLNPALLERKEKGEEETKKKKKSSSGNQQAMLEAGESVVATVELASPHHLMVSVKTLSGTLLAFAATDSGQLQIPSGSYNNVRVGQKVSAAVYSSASNLHGKRRGLPIVVVTGTQVNNKKESVIPQSRPAYMDVKIGDLIDVIVKGVKTGFLSVRYHLWQGRVHCCLATDEPDIGHTPFVDVNPGDSVRARVVGMRKKDIKRLGSKKGASITTLELTTRQRLEIQLAQIVFPPITLCSLLDQAAELRPGELLKTRFSEGEELVGFVNEVRRNLRRHFAEGEAVSCTVVSGRKKGRQPLVSLIGKVPVPTVGSVIDCLVHEATPLCLTVSTPWWAGLGRVDLTDLADKYTEDPLREFREMGEDVRCCVVRVSGDKVDLSLRQSRLSPGCPAGDSPDREIMSLEDLPEGAVVRGYVKAVTDVGVFVRLGRGIDGRVQIKNLTDGFVKDFKKEYNVGQLVTTKVLSVDSQRGQIELSLRLSHTDPVAAKRERRRADKERVKQQKVGTKIESDGDSVESDSSEEEEADTELEEEEVEEGEDEARLTLQLSGCEGFVWEREEVKRDVDELASEKHKEPETETLSSKKSRRQKKAALKAEEELLYQTERAQLEAQAPENVEDYERLLLSKPNSSALWIQYMSFLLQTAEVDKARAVGEKALQSISFREEGERLNVWVARLNLENLYGSQESLMAVFRSALQQNDPLEVSRRLASIYQESDKMDLAEQLYQTMTRQFRSEISVWNEFGLFLMRRGKLEAARRLLQRCLKALALKQQHVDVISRFAQWEYRYGDAGRGGTMFESLLASYPRRTDLWSVYVDMLVKAGQTEQAREVLERAIHLKLSARKMKLMFKRYLEFERQFGTPAGVEVVKDKARTYVEGKLAEN